VYKPAVVASVAIILVGGAVAQEQILTDEQRTAEFNNMHWVSDTTQKLSDSNSTIVLPPGYMMVVGAEAERFVFLANGVHESTTEAAVVNTGNYDSVIFEFIDDGYVTSDDWNEVDAVSMLDSIKQSTADANTDRRKQGIEELTVIGWLQEPTLDRQTNTVFWAIEGAGAESGPVVNAIALRLGRFGYERLNWITSPEQYKSAGTDLDVMLRAHSFDPGARYVDYVSGDKVAGYGIASLVAAVAGAKLAKAAGVGAILLLLKKFMGVAIVAVVAVLAGAWRAITRPS
jgi:uncharacterized membrane-anchored protein